MTGYSTLSILKMYTTVRECIIENFIDSYDLPSSTYPRCCVNHFLTYLYKIFNNETAIMPICANVVHLSDSWESWPHSTFLVG